MRTVRTSIGTELHQTLAEFTTRYRNFSTSVKHAPSFHGIRVDLPATIAVTAEPTPISPEKTQALLMQLCGKLNNCRK